MYPDHHNKKNKGREPARIPPHDESRRKPLSMKPVPWSGSAELTVAGTVSAALQAGILPSPRRRLDSCSSKHIVGERPAPGWAAGVATFASSIWG